jgi:cellulose synthase/poly-beta-1,6-N-acetylglucosamine synthase-like glycosyltransferase
MPETFQPYASGSHPQKPTPEREPQAMRWLVLPLVTLILLCLYPVFRTLTFLDPGYRPVDRVASILLTGAELFIILHALGYLLSTIKASRRHTAPQEHLLAAFREPPVAVLVTSFNESVVVLEETLAAVSALDYGQKTLYLVDDSTQAEARAGAEALARRYGARLVRRSERRGYKAGAINDLLPQLSEPFLLILDADCRPVANFLRDVVDVIQADPKLSFVQTPQFYERTGDLPVAFAAAMQQAVFYEYICEGKSASEAMFCCGTNVIFRRAALLAIGRRVGNRIECFDESSVTEDFATSFLLHLQGWRSRYYNRVYAYGMGPETLSAYFTQQTRWAIGTLGIFRRVLVELLRHPWTLRPGQWWEYLLSSTYYFVGWVNFIFIILPVSYLLLDVRPLIADPAAYLAAFVPYFSTSLACFYTSMGRRGYRVRDLWLGQVLGFNTLWVYMKAATAAMLGRNRAFGVTPKGVGGKLPLRALWPQGLLMILSYVAGLWGLLHFLYLGHSLSILINVFWAWYHVLLLSSLFLYFNRTVAIQERPSLFERYLLEEEASKALDPGGGRP